jgi:hypothetical protein
MFKTLEVSIRGYSLNLNKMANICKKVFFRKTGGFDVYKWCPGATNYDKKLNNGRQNKIKETTPYFCTATSNSQGIDFINTYVYNNILINEEPSRLAYVACDYVS